MGDWSCSGSRREQRLYSARKVTERPLGWVIRNEPVQRGNEKPLVTGSGCSILGVWRGKRSAHRTGAVEEGTEMERCKRNAIVVILLVCRVLFLSFPPPLLDLKN